MKQGGGLQNDLDIMCHVMKWILVLVLVSGCRRTARTTTEPHCYRYDRISTFCTRSYKILPTYCTCTLCHGTVRYSYSRPYKYGITPFYMCGMIHVP